VRESVPDRSIGVVVVVCPIINASVDNDANLYRFTLFFVFTNLNTDPRSEKLPIRFAINLNTIIITMTVIRTGNILVIIDIIGVKSIDCVVSAINSSSVAKIDIYLFIVSHIENIYLSKYINIFNFIKNFVRVFIKVFMKVLIYIHKKHNKIHGDVYEKGKYIDGI